MTTPLGKLADLHQKIDTIEPMRARGILKSILVRMAEIDGNNVTKSAYRDLKPGEQDEPPNGCDYNLLWDAIIDEIEAGREP